MFICMKIYTYPLGPVQSNCYVLVKDHHAILIDPGAVFDALDSILLKEEAVLDAILLTHAHFDHIGGVDSILAKYPVDVYLNPYEFDFLLDTQLNSSMYFYQHIQCHATCQPFVQKEMEIGAFSVEPIFLPGHSIGSTVLKIENNLFTGDVLFQGSIGRCDLETGSTYAMQKSLQYFKDCTEDYPIYPGHGPSSTVYQEKRWNPYLCE